MSGGPWNYVYDGSGLRVKKSNSFGGTLYWRRFSGDAIAETDLNGNTTNEYVFFAGRRISRIDASGNVFFYYADHLGTTRTITNGTGTVCYDADFTPYGQEMVHTNNCPQNYKFTGYERDSETGLDYAIARGYDSRLGRFSAMDPFGGDLSDPQSLHRYAYGHNNPTGWTDPQGLTPYNYQVPLPPFILDEFVVLYLELYSSGMLSSGDIVSSGGSLYAPVGSSHQLGPIFDPTTNEWVTGIKDTTTYALIGDWSSAGFPSLNDNSSDSKIWLQTKVFFQALGRNFIDEFKEGGCVNVFAQAFNEGGSSHIIPDLPAGSGVDDAVRTTAQATAATYAINQGLTVPLRSSIYRGILAGGETAAAGFVAADFFIKAVEGAVAEGRALRNGRCH